jgi:hypothetical protein
MGTVYARTAGSSSVCRPWEGGVLEAASGVEPLMEVLQTSALPLGYAASVDAPHDKEADDRAHGFCPLPRPREGDWSG